MRLLEEKISFNHIMSSLVKRRNKEKKYYTLINVPVTLVVQAVAVEGSLKFGMSSVTI